jgi:hypothetical protein
MIAVQYLEYDPALAEIASAEVRAQLRAAFDRLPISCVILGWCLPERLSRACAQETARAGAQLFLWHPLLTGSPAFVPHLEWQTVGLDGQPVPAFRGMPEFTFLCPNRPAVREAVMEHFRRAIGPGGYQGVFLDRIRFPSPASDPGRHLACFCADCRRAAAAEGFDLSAAQHRIQALLASPERFPSIVHLLLDASAETASDAELDALREFLDFRARSIARFIEAVACEARDRGLATGLDCFSPALSCMVGQDLGALNAHCAWIKIMTYGHTLGPAGVPFELFGLARWLVESGSAREAEALDWLAQAARVPLAASLDTLCERGLSPDALAQETRRARAAGVGNLLAGIELVDLEGVTRLDEGQIAADLRALREADPDGLVLSWDLWRIPPERLEIVRRVWSPQSDVGSSAGA